MNEYISKQRVKDLMGCCLADVKAEYKAAKGEFTKSRFAAYISAIQSMIDVVDSVETADVQHVDRWISCEDRVPDESGKYLCYLATDEMEVVEFCREIEDDECNNNYPFGVWNTYPSDDGGECREWIEILEVTHWQPLPEPPKDGEQNV